MSIELDVVALLVALIGSPSVLAYLTNRARRKERVAEQKRQEIADARFDEVAARASVAAASQATQLQQIHILVNNNLTQAQQRELDATRQLAQVKMNLIAIKRENSILVTDEEHAEVLALEQRITRLARSVADRLRKTQDAESL